MADYDGVLYFLVIILALFYSPHEGKTLISITINSSKHIRLLCMRFECVVVVFPLKIRVQTWCTIFSEIRIDRKKMEVYQQSNVWSPQDADEHF